MLSDDEKALTDRFQSGFDDDADQVLYANQPAQKVDQARIFCRWKIEPGASEKTESNGTVTTLGVAILQIVAPLGSWDDDARAMRDRLVDLFRDWRSPDMCLKVRRTSIAMPPSDDSYQIECWVHWRSDRRP